MSRYLLVAPMGVNESQITIPEHIKATEYEFVNSPWLLDKDVAYLIDTDYFKFMQYAHPILDNLPGNVVHGKMEVEHGQG